MAEKKEKTAQTKPVEKRIAVVTTGSLNVRKAPSLDAEVLTIIRRATEVTVLQTKVNKEWVKITTGDISGYVMKQFIAIK